MNYTMQAAIINRRLDFLYSQYWNIAIHNKIKYYEEQLTRIRKILLKRQSDDGIDLQYNILTVREHCINKSLTA